MKKQLINTQTKEILLEFEGENTVIYSKFLENEMRNMGIPIPHGLRGVYRGKDCIRLKDEEFQRAFREIYYITTIDPEKFFWREQ